MIEPLARVGRHKKLGKITARRRNRRQFGDLRWWLLARMRPLTQLLCKPLMSLLFLGQR